MGREGDRVESDLGCCGEDTAAVHRRHVYPAELLGRPE